MSSTAVLGITYTRDAVGRITQKVETIQGAITTYDYGYDAAGRLTTVVKTPQGGASLTSTYSYDSNGNRLAKTDNGGTISGTYDAQDRIVSYGGITYAHNANGDLTSKTQNSATVSYDYDVFGNLRHVTLDNDIALDHVIDGRNRRVGKKVTGTLVQGFLYDDQLRIVAELDGSNAVVGRFVYGTHVNVPELIIKGGTTFRIVHDHLGSPRLVIDTATGAVAQRMDYDEWGIVTLDTNPGFQPFGFAGGLYDTQTKLVRFGARDYDAVVGRWTSKDPQRFLGGQANLLEYSTSDPVNSLDATGLSATALAAGWAAALCEPTPFGEVVMVAVTAGVVTAELVNRLSRRCKWTCIARCNIQNFSDVPNAPLRVEASGSGTTEAAACDAAVAAAQQLSPPGTYTRHCHCTKCWRR